MKYIVIVRKNKVSLVYKYASSVNLLNIFIALFSRHNIVQYIYLRQQTTPVKHC